MRQVAISGLCPIDRAYPFPGRRHLPDCLRAAMNVGARKPLRHIGYGVIVRGRRANS